MNRPSLQANRGLSLIELMIAMVIGLMLISVAITVVRSNIQSGRLVQSLVSVQANARFALDELSAGIRTAGYVGCTAPGLAPPRLPESVGSDPVARSDWQPIAGFKVASGIWQPAMPEDYTVPTKGPGLPLVGSDAFMVEGGVHQGTPLSQRNTDAMELVIDDLVSGLDSGAMALLTNCSRADAFHIDSASRTVGGGAKLVPKTPLNEIYEVSAQYPGGTRVIPYRRALYYIGNTQRFTGNNEPVRALYEHVYPFSDHVPTEIVTGVDAMVIRYRMRNAAGQTQVMAATDTGFDPALIVGVRIGLLMSTEAHIPDSSSVPEYQLAGVVVQPVGEAASGAPNYPDDPRVRQNFERSVMVRNRLQTGLNL